MNNVRTLVLAAACLALAAHAPASTTAAKVGFGFSDTLHPWAGKSLHVAADTGTLFVCDFENGAEASDGTAVRPAVAEGVEFIRGPFGTAVRARRLGYPGRALIDPHYTYFGFWFRPDFDPATDTQQRVILQMGDGQRRSLVLRTNGAGKLSLILSDDDYATACHADISSWRRGEWHHIAGWFKGPPVEDRLVRPIRRVPMLNRQLWLLLDGYGVDSSVWYHNDGLRDEDLTTVYLGGGPEGEPSGAIDEVVFANTMGGRDSEMRGPIEERFLAKAGGYQTVRAHHDWMLGMAHVAAAGRLKTTVTPDVWGVAANPKAVAGTVRTFGLQCEVPRYAGITERGLVAAGDPAASTLEWMVFNVPDYSYAPFLHEHGIGERVRWSSSNTEIADVQLEPNPFTGALQPTTSGRFEIKKPGRCRIIAEMGGRRWTYNLTVIERNRPDLLVQFISRSPRYERIALKDRPAPGDPVEFEVHVANRGFAPSRPATVKLSVYESGGLADLDTRKRRLIQLRKRIPALQVGEQTRVRFPWTWREDPCHIVATIATRQPEISTHNNERSYLTNRSRNIYLLIDPESWGIWQDVNDNHTGSFALEDWLEAQRAVWDRLLREAIYPATSPYGIQVRLHIDALIEMHEDPGDLGKNDPGPYWDGGWICSKNWTGPNWAPGVEWSLMHEWGHGAFAGADLYSFGIWAPWVYIEDESGNRVAGTGALPATGLRESRSLIYRSSDETPDGTNGRYLCETMMSFCGPQLHEGFAGHIQHNFDLRAQGIWQIHRRAVPLIQNSIVVLDIEGNPVEGAEIAVYQQSAGIEANSSHSFWPNVIKFAGRTNAEGEWAYPYETAPSFDDPDTDVVEGETQVASFLSTAVHPWPSTPGVYSNNSMQIIAVRKGPWTEYHVLDSFQVATEAYRNDRLKGAYVIQTNLPPALDDVETKPFTITPAQDLNERPVVVVPEVVHVDPGAQAEIDAGQSYDPEGRPVTVYWIVNAWRQDSQIAKLGGSIDASEGPVLEFTAPDKPCEVVVKVYCHDTVRVSEQKEVRIIVGGGPPTDQAKGN